LIANAEKQIQRFSEEPQKSKEIERRSNTIKCVWDAAIWAFPTHQILHYIEKLQMSRGRERKNADTAERDREKVQLAQSPPTPYNQGRTAITNY